MRLGIAFLIVFALTPGASRALAETADPQATAIQLFKRLTGTPISASDSRLAQMVTLIKKGDIEGAAAIATDDDHFYTAVARNFAAVMATKAESTLAPFDDFQATVIGAIRDNLDARTLLTGNYLYRGDSNLGVTSYSSTSNSHYLEIDSGHYSLKKYLVKQEPQRNDIPEYAGLLTTRGWASAHLVAGTNRRGIEYLFREFLCTPIQEWKDPGQPDFHVRRDVDRAPGGNPTTYATTCRSCHALMDGMGGAYARFDFVNDALTYVGPTGVVAKMNKNGNVYPQGYMTLDDSWINMATQHHNESFGWRGPVSGKGLRELATMVANAKKFSSCMTTRVFKEVCKREPESSEAALISGLADEFESGGYKLRVLFQKVAAQPACL